MIEDGDCWVLPVQSKKKMLLGVSFPDNEAAAASAEEAKDGGQWLSKKQKSKKAGPG